MSFGRLGPVFERVQECSDWHEADKESVETGGAPCRGDLERHLCQRDAGIGTVTDSQGAATLSPVSFSQFGPVGFTFR